MGVSSLLHSVFLRALKTPHLLYLKCAASNTLVNLWLLQHLKFPEVAGLFVSESLSDCTKNTYYSLDLHLHYLPHLYGFKEDVILLLFT